MYVVLEPMADDWEKCVLGFTATKEEAITLRRKLRTQTGEVHEINEYAHKRICEQLTLCAELRETVRTGLSRRARGTK